MHQVLKSGFRFRRVKVELKDVILPLILSLLGNIFILALWQGISPLQYERHPVEYAEDEYRRSTASQGTCANSSNLYYKWFIVALAVINGAALLLANFQAYRARHVQTELSESRYLGLSMGVMSQGFLIGLPAFVTDTSTTASYAIIAALVSLVSGSVLYLIFIPKILARRSTSTEKETANRSSDYGLKIEHRHLVHLEDRPPIDQKAGLRVKSHCSVVMDDQEEPAENEASAADNVIDVVDPAPTELPEQSEPLGN